jgi:D-serine deaminase-like pyridoxal phosphate-dependent protein
VATAVFASPVERAAALAQLVHDTPEIAIDLDVVHANVGRAAAAAAEAGVALRPHAKTHKLPQIAAMQLEAGAAGIQVAKLGEAEVMVESGVEDILVGYPIVGEVKLARLVALARRARISTVLDSLEVAEGVSAAVAAAGLTIPVLLEVDTGLHRLGLPPGAAAADLAERVASLPAIDLRGVFTHEGHVYGLGRDAAEKEELTRAACAAAVETAAELRRRGLPAPVVSVGSAGTFRFAIHCPGVTELRPGTYVFNDRSQLAQGSATEDDLAAFIVTTIVGRPARDRLVVDAGSKVLSSDRMLVATPPASFGRVLGRDGWDVVRLSEEHGILEVPPGAEARIGDRVAIVPNHVCPTINLASFVSVVEGGELVGRWPVAARGKVQ